MKRFLKHFCVIALLILAQTIFAQEYVNGFAKTEKDGKFNFLNEDGDLISKVWFTDAGYFSTDGFALVQQGKDNFNFLKKDGTLLSKAGYKPIKDPTAYGLKKNEKTYDYGISVNPFGSAGFALIVSGWSCIQAVNSVDAELCSYTLINWIKKDGTLLGKKWLEIHSLKPSEEYHNTTFFDISNKLESYFIEINEDLIARITDGTKYNFMKISDNSLISKDWYTATGNFNGDLVVVQKGINFNVLRLSTGKLFSQNPLTKNEVSLDSTYLYDGGIGATSIFMLDFNGLSIRILNTDGTLSDIYHIYDQESCTTQLCIVYKPDEHSNQVFNLLKVDNSFLSQEWFSDIKKFKNGVAKVARGNYNEKRYYNFISSDGKLLSHDWFRDAKDFKDGFAAVRKIEEDNTQAAAASVQIVEKWNFLKLDGTFLSQEWFASVDNFKDGTAKVYRADDTYNFIKPDGTFVYTEWKK